MNIHLPVGSARMTGACLGIAIVSLLLGGCSTPHGYGVDERGMRNADGSSGVVAGAEAPGANAVTPAMHSQSTYLSLITQMQHEGQYFASLAHLDAYEARFGRSPESILLRGDAERLTDQPELATRSYEALKDTPLAGAGYRGLSLLAGARGDFTTAAALLEEALRSNSTDAVTLSDLGYAKLELGDLSGARVPLMTAAQLTPTNPKIMSNLALYLILNHDAKQAEAVMKSAGVSAPTRHAIYLQASRMSHGSVGEVSQSVSTVASLATTPQSVARTTGAESSSADGSKATGALRIDFALASPAVASTAGAVEIGAASTER